MFTKIVTETQAEELVEFATQKFNLFDLLTNWLNPIYDELGVVAQAQFTIHCSNNDSYQRTQRHFLMLNFGTNKTIIFVGNVYKNWRENYISGKVDFSGEQTYAKQFFDLQSKNEQYIEHLKQAEETYNELQTLGKFI